MIDIGSNKFVLFQTFGEYEDYDYFDDHGRRVVPFAG